MRSFEDGQQKVVTPALFIGLGGIGSRIVNRIAARAQSLSNWQNQIKDVTAFVSLDTNTLDQNELAHIPVGNRILIGAFDKQTVVRDWRRSAKGAATQWLDPAYQPRPGITPGAGQDRMGARLGFYFDSPQIAQRLKQLVSETLSSSNIWRQGHNKDYKVYIYCSLAGGTGSGTFLSVAYLIRQLILETTWQPCIVGNLLLSTLVSDFASRHVHADLHANTYAALKELEHLTKLDCQEERASGRNKEPFAFWNDQTTNRVSEVSSAPFSLTFIYDKPAQFALPAVEPVIADAAFLQVFTSNMACTASLMDNYGKVMESLTRPSGVAPEMRKGYAKSYGAMGAAALVLPGERLLEYCALRFAAESVRRQFTFGVDTRQPTDDRGRALARFAVNYADPKFLGMNDEARGLAINHAFLESVREMARQERREGSGDGHWTQLVQSVDVGCPAGADEKGDIRWTEALLALVRRRLNEQRQPIIQKLVIKERAFVFQKEGIGQYRELVNRLTKEVRAAQAIVERDMVGLRRSAVEGEVITDLQLNPIAERYLTLRVVEECEEKWIPEAQTQVERARQKDISNSKVTDRFEEEYKSLEDAARSKKLFFRAPDDDFSTVRDRAQDYYHSVVVGCRKMLDAEMQLSQYRELLAGAQERSHRYASLARRMDGLASELERCAEDLRLGQDGDSRFALSVEVFETLTEPRSRIWDKVYSVLSIDEGRELSTFAPAVFSSTIGHQLKSAIRTDGSSIENTEEQSIYDLRQALINLGNKVLSAKIFGGSDHPGLDVEKGLRLEACLTLQEDKSRRGEVSEWEIEAYFQRKFRELSQISGLLARVKSGEWKALGDGVMVSRTRHLVHGMGAGAEQSAFIRHLRAALTDWDLNVSVDGLHDRNMAIVYDLELPIPLYYFEAVIGQAEEAYLNSQSDTKRWLPLHTDYHWEETLPNLNPRLSELEGRPTLGKLADALTAGLVQQGDGRAWVLRLPGGKVDVLGETLSAVLYRYGRHWRSDAVGRWLDAEIVQVFKSVGAEEVKERRRRWQTHFENVLHAIAHRENDQCFTRDDVLDRLATRLLWTLLEEQVSHAGVPISHPDRNRRDGRHVRIVVENADALQFPADVLALKYAQALHGVDRAVGAALSSRIPDLLEQLPEVGDSRLLPAAPCLPVDHVLFVGVKPLRQFRYGEIREFARRVLTVLAHSAPTVRHIAVTVHGPEQGLDEVESFESEIAGFVDSLIAGTFPDELIQISIVEIQPRRAERLKRLLAEWLKTGTFAIEPEGRPESELPDVRFERILDAGYGSENKPLAFVAMPFREDMLDYYEYGIQSAVKTMGFLCERADQAHFTGDILQWVKERIARSSVVIADLSFANPNVYLEVGYAWGCGKPTILLVRHGDELKFDVIGQRCLFYRRIKDLEDSLRKELGAFSNTDEKGRKCEGGC